MINQIRALVVLYKVQKTFTVTEGLSQHILWSLYLSQDGVLSKLLNVSLCNQRRIVA